MNASRSIVLPANNRIGLHATRGVKDGADINSTQRQRLPGSMKLNRTLRRSFGCRYFYAERDAVSMGRHELFVIARRVFGHQLDERVDGNGGPERKADHANEGRHKY